MVAGADGVVGADVGVGAGVGVGADGVAVAGVVVAAMVW